MSSRAAETAAPRPEPSSADARPWQRAERGQPPGRRLPPVARNTHVVPGLRRLVEGQVHAAFPHRIWVIGEVGRIVSDDDGGVRFELCADDEGQPLRLLCGVPGAVIPELREVLSRIHDADVEDVLVQGRLARVGGLLRFDFVSNGLHLTVSELDPSTTSQGLTEDREASLERVRAGGLAQHQSVVTASVAPTRIAVVGAPEDPELLHAVERLSASGYAVQATVIPVPRHAVGHAGHLARAVTLAARQSDMVLLLRGQGRPLGLAVYDSEDLARAVAAAGVPVVTGLGGGGEHTATDEVAAASLPTAAAAAESVLVRLRAAEQALRASQREIAAAARDASSRAHRDLRQARAAVEAAAAEADRRAAAAHRRRWVALLTGCALLAVALVVVAVRRPAPLLLLGLPVLAAVLLSARWWSTRISSQGSRTVDLQDVDFAHVLERLDRVRDELVHSSSPERVYRLRDTAAQLVARGEQILGRRLDGSPLRAEPARPPAADVPGRPAPAAQAVPTGAVPTGPVTTAGAPTAGAPMAGAPTAGATTAGAPTAGAPTGAAPAGDAPSGPAATAGAATATVPTAQRRAPEPPATDQGGDARTPGSRRVDGPPSTAEASTAQAPADADRTIVLPVSPQDAPTVAQPHRPS